MIRDVDLWTFSNSARSFALYEFLLCYSFNFTRIRMFLNYQMLESFNNYRGNSENVMLYVPMVGSLLVAWIADSYVGKFNVVFIGLFLSSIAPIFCGLSFVTVGSEGASDQQWMVAHPFDQGIEWGMGFFLAMEGTRLAFLFDQCKLPREQMKVRHFLTLVVLVTLFAELLLELSFITIYHYPDTYPAFSIVSAVFFALYINRMISSRNEFNQERISFGICFRTLACIMQAIYLRVNLRIAEKEHWLDYSDDGHSYFIIFGAKRFITVIGFCLPAIALSITTHLIHNSMQFYTHFLLQHKSEIYFSYSAPAMYKVISIFALLLMELAIIPVMEKIKLCRTNLHCLVFTFIIQGFALLSVFAFEFYSEIENGIAPVTGGSRIRIYNGCGSSLRIKVEGPEKLLTPTESFVFSTSFPNQNRHVKIKKGDQNFTYYIEPVLFESLTYIIKEETLDKISKPAPIYQVGPNYEFHGQVSFMVITNGESLNGFMTINGVKWVLEGDVVTLMTSPGEVKIELEDVNVYDKSPKVELGHAYSILLYQINGTVTNATLDVLSYPSKIKVGWIIYPMCVTAFGDVLSRVTLFCFFYMESPPKLKSLVITLLIASLNLGKTVHTLHQFKISKTKTIYITHVIFLHIFFLLILIYRSSKYKYRLAQML